MKVLSNVLVGKQDGRSILADVYFNEIQENKPVVIFTHGFKGFKNWGAWHLVAEQFALEGFVFVAYNNSHNGIGETGGVDFEDLQGFAQDTYTKELNDLNRVLDWVRNGSLKELGISETSKTHLIGHSRGGGIALVAATENNNVTSIATWASIANFNRFGNEKDIADWKANGIRYTLNGRTKQNMPLNYTLHEDYLENQNHLDVEARTKEIAQPLVVVHGTEDNAVGTSHAIRISNWARRVELKIIDGANHVFGANHPFEGEHLPKHLQEVTETTLRFFKS